MKVQIRRGVFETNSSSTHALSIYTKEQWEDFKKGNSYCGWTLSEIKTKDELLDDYAKYLKKYHPDKEITEAGFESWLADETMTYDDICERYDLLYEEVPDSNYIAVSIEGYDY